MHFHAPQLFGILKHTLVKHLFTTVLACIYSSGANKNESQRKNKQSNADQKMSAEQRKFTRNMGILISLFVCLQLLREVTIGHPEDQAERKFGEYVHRSIIILALNGLVCAFHLVLKDKQDGNYIKKSGLLQALFFANMVLVKEYLIVVISGEYLACQNDPEADFSTCLRSVYSLLIGRVADTLNLVSFTARSTEAHACKNLWLAPTAGLFYISFDVLIVSSHTGSCL